jgi:phytoene desaturase
VHGFSDPSVAHHNIHFGTEWSSAFDALLNRGELMPHPSRLVTVPSMDDATLAPTGFSTLYVLEPVPNLKGKITWSSEAGPLRERLQTFLTEHGHPSEVITEDLVTPWGGRPRECRRHAVRAVSHLQPDRTVPPIERRTSPAGHVLRWIRDVPGVGVPMVLISGKLAASRVAAYLPEASR